MGRSTATHPGDRLGTLVAVCPTEERYHGSVVWKWRCDCGEERLGIAAYLRQQLLRCGHLRCPRCRSKTQPGDRLGSLVAVRPTGKRNRGKIVWEWQCDCGGVRQGVAADLRQELRYHHGCLRCCAANPTGSAVASVGARPGFAASSSSAGRARSVSFAERASASETTASACNAPENGPG